MKNRSLITLSLSLLSLLIFVGQSYAQDGWRPGQYMRQAVNKTLAMAVLANMTTDYGFADNNCFLGAYLKKGSKVKFNTMLTAGQKYSFIGGGDDDATDLDIKIFDSDNNMLAEDSETDNNPMVVFTPKRSEKYTLELSLYSTHSSGSFSCLAILKENAGDIDIEDLDAAITNSITLGALINDKVPMKFHDDENQWCLFGSVLGSAGSTGISNLSLGNSDHIFAAAGDENTSDIDLFLKTGDKTVSSDTETDAIPIIEYTTASSNLYTLNYKNVESNGPALVLVMILTK